MAICGKLKFPGDKSISHRALMLAALADGTSEITNLSTGVDVETTKKCLENCGITFINVGTSVKIEGGSLQSPVDELDCGNSGTTARLLMGLLAGQKTAAKFIGDGSLSERPMKRVIDPLEKMGATINSIENHLPLSLSVENLTGIRYELPVASAQVKSAILLAGLGADTPTTVIEPIPTRNHTENMLSKLGAEINTHENTITVYPLINRLNPFKTTIPGDPSTAAFFAAAAAMISQSDLMLEGISTNPTRSGFYTALKQMGGNVEILNQLSEQGESRGDICIVSNPLNGINIAKDMVPGLIDELPILAILASQAEGVTEVTGAKELRFKECDRIHAICMNLGKMGANITELEDGFVIEGPTKLRGGYVRTFNDHRIAMAFTIAGLVADGDVTLDNQHCVDISFPQFYEWLKIVR